MNTYVSESKVFVVDKRFYWCKVIINSILFECRNNCFFNALNSFRQYKWYTHIISYYRNNLKMFLITTVLLVITLRLDIVCNAESLPIPSPLSIVSIARSSSVGINEGVNSLINRHKSCPEGYELGTDIFSSSNPMHTKCTHKVTLSQTALMYPPIPPMYAKC